MLERLFRRWDPPRELRPTSDAPPSDLAIRWLGTAGHALRANGETLLIDPFVTRPSFGRMLRRLRPDLKAAQRWAPEATAVVVGHSHYDHVLDAPGIAARTGATFIGSTSAARVASGVVPAEKIVAAPPSGLRTTVGPFEVQLVPSLHAKLVLGLAPPFPGEIERTPTRFFHYRSGTPFGVVVRAGGITVYHNGSADLIDAELAGLKADVLLLGIAGWRVTRGYLERLVRLLEPRVIVPTHYDAFFWPLEEGVRLLPRLRFEEFLEEVRRLAPRATIATPSPWEELRVGPSSVAVVDATASATSPLLPPDKRTTISV